MFVMYFLIDTNSPSNRRVYYFSWNFRVIN